MTHKCGDFVKCINAPDKRELDIIPSEYLNVGEKYEIIDVYNHGGAGRLCVVVTDEDGDGCELSFYSRNFASDTPMLDALKRQKGL
jgi:hypothetical protein